jgi:hypothetical protein
MLPELQRIIADYAQPERRFVSATADATQPDGWRIERLEGNELRQRLLQPRMEELKQQLRQQQQQGAAGSSDPVALQENQEEQEAALQSRTLDDLLAARAGLVSTPTDGQGI